MVKYSIRMVEEYIFCPMMFNYKYVLGINKPPSLWSELGLRIQEELSRYVEENYVVLGRQVYMESEKYMLSGIVDYVVKYMGRPAPLEIKYTKRLKPWWKYTLTAYALLVEETYNKPVKTAILIMPGPRTKIIYITDSDRRYIVETVKTIDRILKGEIEPKPKPSKQCTNCDYKDICPYKQTN